MYSLGAPSHRIVCEVHAYARQHDLAPAASQGLASPDFRSARQDLVLVKRLRRPLRTGPSGGRWSQRQFRGRVPTRSNPGRRHGPPGSAMFTKPRLRGTPWLINASSHRKRRVDLMRRWRAIAGARDRGARTGPTRTTQSAGHCLGYPVRTSPATCGGVEVQSPVIGRYAR
jgi:hypothetical protein